MKYLLTAATAAVLLLTACETPSPAAEAAGPPKAELPFVDFPGFDRNLATSLGAALPRVGVSFYDGVAPSALPERVQSWLAAVENGGGKVTIVPPPTAAGTRSPLMLLSALSSLWSASKMAREMAIRDQFKTARTYNAELHLKLDSRSQTVVDKVVFVQRQP